MVRKNMTLLLGESEYLCCCICPKQAFFFLFLFWSSTTQGVRVSFSALRLSLARGVAPAAGHNIFSLTKFELKG